MVLDPWQRSLGEEEESGESGTCTAAGGTYGVALAIGC